MGNRFRWDMFFTSFLPLWISIIISNIGTIVCKGISFAAKTELLPLSPRQILDACIQFLYIVKIEAILVIILAIYTCISIHHINGVIRREQHSNNKSKGTIQRARRANKLTAEFLLAYILPMLAFDFSSLKSIVLFLIYFAVLSFLCVRNSNVYTNVFLELKGYRMYDCDIECIVMNNPHLYTDCLIISTKNLTQTLPLEIEYFDFENYIYIEIGA